MQKLSVGTSADYSEAKAVPEVAPVSPSAPTPVAPPTAAPTATRPYVASPTGVSLTQKGPVTMKKSTSKLGLVIIVVALGAGALTGLGAARLSAKSGTNPLSGSAAPVSVVAGDTINNGDVFGSADETPYKDSAEGYLEIGGLDGEGSHKLIREGGVSQTVYLTSSVTDLSKFNGMQVKVWGETFKAQKAGWLMDVGRVMVVNTQGTPPTEE